MEAYETPGVASSKLVKKVTGATLGSLLVLGTWSAAASASPNQPMPDGPLCPLAPYVLQVQGVIGESPNVAHFLRPVTACEQERPGG